MALKRPRRLRVKPIAGFSVNRLIPNILTLLALCAGMTAIRLALLSRFEPAVASVIVAGVLDGIDGRIARLLKGTSTFGAELDSLSDFVSFGVAPATLLYVWTMDGLHGVGWALALLFTVCCALRLARFNVQKNPIPKNPGVPNRKYFVGLPIPAAAGMVAAVVYAFDSYPVTEFYWSIVWMALLALLSFLMVSTWRYWSFKELNLSSPRSPVLLVVMGGVIFAIWNWAQPVLLILASTYVASGILIRAGGIIRRYFRRKPRPEPLQETPIV